MVTALCLPLSLTAHCSPFLPSGDTTEETVEQITLRLSLCFYSFPSFLGNPLTDRISPIPNGTRHPALLGRLAPRAGPIPTNHLILRALYVTLKGDEVIWVQRTQDLIQEGRNLMSN